MNKPEENMKNGKRVPIQHGEVFMQPVDSVPEGAESKEAKSHIIGHSESSHHHTLVSDQPFEVMEETEKHDLYVRLFQPADVKHEKSFDIHETKRAVPGDYAIYHKTEFDPFAQVVRRVFD